MALRVVGGAKVEILGPNCCGFFLCAGGSDFWLTLGIGAVARGLGVSGTAKIAGGADVRAGEDVRVRVDVRAGVEVTVCFKSCRMPRIVVAKSPSVSISLFQSSPLSEGRLIVRVIDDGGGSIGVTNSAGAGFAGEGCSSELTLVAEAVRVGRGNFGTELAREEPEVDLTRAGRSGTKKSKTVP